MYIFIYTLTHIHTYIRIYVYIYIHSHLYTHTYLRLYVQALQIDSRGRSETSVYSGEYDVQARGDYWCGRCAANDAYVVRVCV